VAETSRFSLATVVPDCPDAHVLADFYSKLLVESDIERARLGASKVPRWRNGLSFQSEADYRPPVWPERPDEQQKMLHLDIRVDDLDEAGAHALAAGARLADFQPQEDVRVYLDPAGHPFCLFLH
jgi:hypothetical protein